MPEVEFPKLRPHPFRNTETKEIPRAVFEPGAEYAELCVTSNFTFLHGASHPEELVYTAAALGYRAVAITDLHSLAGVVRAHVAAKEYGVSLVVGARLRLTDVPGMSVFVYPTDRASYGRLCRMLSVGKRRAEKGACTLTLADLAAHADGVLSVALLDEVAPVDAETQVQRLKDEVSRDLWLAVRVAYHDHDAEWVEQVVGIGRRSGLPIAATNDVLYHVPERRPLQDVLTCIRHGCTMAQAGLRLQANAERHLKPRAELQRLFRRMPEAIEQTVEIARRAEGFSLDQLRYDYPDEVVPAGTTPIRHLAELTEKGAAQRYPEGVSEKVRQQIAHELQLIDELNYAPYFLTVHDLVTYARSKGILCQGRGAAANSAVCFCLGVTAVDPTRIDVLFERFVSKERNEPPDIDIDFEHERREEVIQYIYSKYGRERAALTAEVISYRRRSAVRDVGKALGFSLDLVDRLAKDIEWWDDGFLDAGRLRSMGLNPEDPTIQWFLRLTAELLGFPRHLSQHVGGFVISQPPLCELVPIENAAMPDRTVIEWDKDDIDALGLLKVDVLGLGMLTALRRCMKLVNDRHGGDLSLATIPPEDPATYAMIQKADTVGVFQIESRAQMSMLPRLRPACFYDLVIEVAIVRPGPIQGDMVHPYLRRRQGLEEPDYAHPVIKEVLHKTLGVPLFQEQCMALAVKAAGFTPGEADQLRRAMAAWKRKGNLIARFGAKLIDGMVANGIDREFAERCFKQVQGFSEYGFPESHAASFALLVYASSWLKCHHPAEFCAALLNSQPMGFYAPAQLIRDARSHGVEVRAVDVHHSDWDCTIERDGALRLGLRMVGGLSQADGEKIRAAVWLKGERAQAVRALEGRPQAGGAEGGRRFASVLALWRASGARAGAMRRLASADAFGSMGLTRQKALWHARRLRDERLPLFDPIDATTPAVEVSLPPFSDSQEVRQDYASVGLTLRRHPMSFVREALRAKGVRVCSDLNDEKKTEGGEWVAVAGLVLVRQRPGTAKGVTFLTLEDETGIANIVVWQQTYQRYRRAAGGRVVIVHGRVQRQDNVVHVVAHKLQQIGAIRSESVESASLHGLAVSARNFR